MGGMACGVPAQALILDKRRASTACRTCGCRAQNAPMPIGMRKVRTMATMPTLMLRRAAHAQGRPRVATLGATTALLALSLTGCSLEWQNRQAAQEVANAATPPGSVHRGWRLFQDKCASCHGSAATGSAGGPNLLPRVREMGSRQFVSTVLYRYDWGLPVAKDSRANPALDALLEDLLQRRQHALTMPAWQGEPSVTVHIADLYAYLSARAQGLQGPERPSPSAQP